MQTISSLLETLRLRGVTVWEDGGSLRYRASSKLTAQDLECLRRRKFEILDYLKDREPRLVPRLRSSHSNEKLPATLQQQWLWYVLLPSYSSEVFNVSGSMWVSGEFDLSCLKESLTALASKHEALRSRFMEIEGNLYQEFSVEPSLSFEALGESGVERRDVESDARALAGAFVRQRLCHSSGPLFRVQLVRLKTDEYLLTFLLDHMICDGVSLALLVHEFKTFYSTFSRRLALEHEAELIQYGDYAIWQKSGENYWVQHSASYWANRLMDALPICFPPDVEVEHETPRFDFMRVSFGKDLSEALHERALAEGTSLPMALLTAFVVLVSRWCNQNDFVVPFNSMGRQHPELMSTIGDFSHIVHLRMELVPKDTYREILSKVIKEFETASLHDDFGRVVRSLPQFVRGSWFQCEPMFVEELEVTEVAKGVLIRTADVPVPAYTELNEGFAVDLGFLFTESSHNIVATMSYRKDRFNVDSITVIGEYLKAVCREFGARPDSEPSRL